MVISLELADPRHPDVQKLLQTGHAAMQAQFPAKRQIPFPIEPVLAEGAYVFVARAEGRAVGCCALLMSGDLAELKRLYVAPEARRQGAAVRLVAHVEAFAKDARFPQLELETGAMLSAAHQLYLWRGFTRCDAFGNHVSSTESLFFAKSLVAQTT